MVNHPRIPILASKYDFVDLTVNMEVQVRIPQVNPPGGHYRQ